jgi:tRNA(fMet)-specific endonuclease VapC
MDYLLDTNACIAVINGSPAPVRDHMRKAIDSGAQVFISSIVLFELWYGVGKSARPQANAQRVEAFLSGPVTVLAFIDSDSRVARSIRAALEVSGKPIGAYDLLIAGQAIARELVLVTTNLKEFSRVKGLKWEDWAKL